MDAIPTIADMIRDAERHAEHQANDRQRANEYYRGEMKDTPFEDGRSGMTTRDVRAQVKKVLPSVMRTLLGSDRLVEYTPVNEGDEAGAEQATDYVNLVVAPETNLRRQIEDALHDALLQRNGIIRWYWSEKTEAMVSHHSGLLEEAMLDLAAEEGVEVLEHAERVEMVDAPTPEGDVVPTPVTVHDVSIKRLSTSRGIRVDAVPREQFLIHSDAVTIEEALVCGIKTELSRSDLVAMGYDRETVDALKVGEEDDDDNRRADHERNAGEPHPANDPIDYYDVFVRFDADGDGIAELHHMCFAGGLAEKNLLRDDYADEIQYADIKVMSQPHQWEGISLADDLMDIQRAKTVLLRGTFDNLYWQNNLQPIVQRGAVKDAGAVMNPEFGKPIVVEDGFSVRDAVGFQPVPFVAQQSFGMLSYLDEEATDRTGVSDASAGLAPDALQNMTAKASAMIEQAGIGQTELMVKTAAEGLRTMFRGILRLLVKHQDVARTVRLRGEWVQFDPRQWNADMDCAVNVGLGAGTRERDVAVLQVVMGLQEKLLAAFGADNNPFVTPENLWQSLSRLVEASGLKTPEMYFTEPDPEQIAALMQQRSQRQDPATMKAQADAQLAAQQLQLEAQKAQQEFAIRQQEITINAQVNEARAAVELQKARNEEIALQLKMQEFEWRKQMEAARLEFDWADYGVKAERLNLDAKVAGANATLKADEIDMKAQKEGLEAALAMREAAIEEDQRRPVQLGEQ